MKKFLLPALMLLIGSAAMSARHLSPAEALSRVNTASSAMHKAPAATRAPRLLHSAKAGDVEQVYLFGNASGNGFMVVSADDAVPALLGYSDEGIIEADKLPDNLRYWLDTYAGQIAALAESGAEADIHFKQRAAVTPKTTAKWDQMDPYYTYCPTYYGLPCPTGCVATAMAQIMYWHKWPLQPHGAKSFQSYWVGNLSIDFDRIIFAWDQMTDRYNSESSDASKDAVAMLMMACGYAAEMEYHNQASGATGFHAAEGFVTYFGYDKSLSIERREWYDIEEWDDLVYAELTENGPVYYDGTGNGGGHAFVCDGYEAETGLFHFNWGWSGRGNGYYRLSLLNPDYQGTGGNSLGYNYTQDIFRNLKPAKEGVESPYTYYFSPVKGIVTPYETSDLGAPFTLKGYATNDGFANYSIVGIDSVAFGARIHNIKTGADIDIEEFNGYRSFDHYTKVQILRYTMPAELAEGDYTVRPLWRIGKNGEWRELRYALGTRNYVPFTVEGKTVTFGFGEVEGRAEGVVTSVPEFFTTYGDFTVTATLEATGSHDFTGMLCGVFFRYVDDELKVIDQGDVERVDIYKGEKFNLEYTSKPVNGKLTDGDDYGFAIGNATTGEILTPIYAVKVGNRYGKLQMSSYDFSLKSSNFLNPENVSGSSKVKIVSGEYHGPLALGFGRTKDIDSFEVERIVEGGDVDLIAGDDKLCTVTGTLYDVKAGDLYYVHIMYKAADGEWKLLSQYPVTTVVSKDMEPAGVDDVTVNGDTGAIYYDIYGRCVARPFKGAVYIRVLPDGTRSKIVL